MKTKEELNEIKEEVETLNEKLHELTEEELAQVTGGAAAPSLVVDASVDNKGNRNRVRVVASVVGVADCK